MGDCFYFRFRQQRAGVDRNEWLLRLLRAVISGFFADWDVADSRLPQPAATTIAKPAITRRMLLMALPPGSLY
jgi:hypothetical protein